MNDELSELKAGEEAKRDRCWDPLERWLALQATITWAEAQLTVRRNVPANRHREEVEKLARWEILRAKTNCT